jgi:putative endonuclease
VAAKDGVGKYGERVALRHLEDAGFEILARNWRCPDGEIDIVARDRNVLVICEVKTRSGLGYGLPA